MVGGKGKEKEESEWRKGWVERKVVEIEWKNELRRQEEGEVECLKGRKGTWMKVVKGGNEGGKKGVRRGEEREDSGRGKTRGRKSKSRVSH